MKLVAFRAFAAKREMQSGTNRQKVMSPNDSVEQAKTVLERAP